MRIQPPRQLVHACRDLLRHLLAPAMVCSACLRPVRQFQPLPAWYLQQMTQHGSVCGVSDMETLNFTAYACPHCRATDRDRLCALYFAWRWSSEPAANRSASDARCVLLDIAPSPALAQFIRQWPHVDYRSADLHMAGVDDAVDLTDMRIYASDSFDVFICSHVLEHVPDDRRAMAELFRILKPGGWGIVLVPINLRADRIDEDPSITDPGERWRRFLQHDHVRLYSKSGFITRLTEAGFRVLQYGADAFPPGAFARHGIASRSVLYVVEKS